MIQFTLLTSKAFYQVFFLFVSNGVKTIAQVCFERYLIITVVKTAFDVSARSLNSSLHCYPLYISCNPIFPAILKTMCYQIFLFVFVRNIGLNLLGIIVEVSFA